jgi:hypothetical protein
MTQKANSKASMSVFEITDKKLDEVIPSRQ